MKGQQILNLFTTSGVTILRDVYQCSPHDLAGDLMSLNTARKYTRLATVFFGPADSPKVQRDSVALAEARQLSLEYLEMVNKHAKKLKTRGAAWKLRAELIAHEGTLDEVNKYGKQRVTEEGGDKPKQRGVRVGRAIDGLRTISITDTQRRITDLEKTLDAGIKHDEDQPRSEALLDPFWDLVEGTCTGLIRPEHRTLIAIGLENFKRVSCGKGEDVVVALSDGTTMTGS